MYGYVGYSGHMTLQSIPGGHYPKYTVPTLCNDTLPLAQGTWLKPTGLYTLYVSDVRSAVDAVCEGDHSNFGDPRN